MNTINIYQTSEDKLDNIALIYGLLNSCNLITTYILISMNTLFKDDKKCQNTLNIFNNELLLHSSNALEKITEILILDEGFNDKFSLFLASYNDIIEDLEYMVSIRHKIPLKIFPSYSRYIFEDNYNQDKLCLIDKIEIYLLSLETIALRAIPLMKENYNKITQ